MRDDDPRRWWALVTLLMSVVLVVLGNTVLNVAFPTMVRELDTSLAAIQWVVAGYSLVFATLLVIGGRLGDLYGARRMFALGAALFGLGSVVSVVADSVAQLLVGEALIKGIGASLMTPASLSIVSNTFRGRERATAFAAWGAALGAGMAFGPVVGGYLTTYHSWRWAFGIAIVLSPVAVVGALLLVPRDEPSGRRDRLDVPGAVLAGAGTFSLVFGISQSDSYGWSHPLIPGAFVFAALAITLFVLVERRKERADASPLFEFGQLRHLRFRYGVIASLVLAVGQMGMFFVLPVFLQNAKGLTPVDNGLWMLPMGVCILLAAQAGGHLTRVVGTTSVVRFGLVLNTAGLVILGVSLRPDVTFLGLLPGFAVFGLGVGFASSQLVNVILSDIDADKSGVASGANTTARQVGSALGVAIMGTVLSGSTDVAGSARLALLIAAGILAVGAALAFLIPSDRRRAETEETAPSLLEVGAPVGPAGSGVSQ